VRACGGLYDPHVPPSPRAVLSVALAGLLETAEAMPLSQQVGVFRSAT
jgi:hypothetical protein